MIERGESVFKVDGNQIMPSLALLDHFPCAIVSLSLVGSEYFALWHPTGFNP